MEKVKITKEQAKAIEYQLNVDSKSNLVWSRLDPHVTFYSECSVLNKMDPDLLIEALYIGYEVEQTPKEKVREFYYKNSAFPEIAHVIRETVNMLGHKIEGVND
jgi:hypothetical protein